MTRRTQAENPVGRSPRTGVSEPGRDGSGADGAGEVPDANRAARLVGGEDRDRILAVAP